MIAKWDVTTKGFPFKFPSLKAALYIAIVNAAGSMMMTLSGFAEWSGFDRCDYVITDDYRQFDFDDVDEVVAL